MKVNIIVGGRVSTNCYVVEDENKNCLVIDVADSSGDAIASFLEASALNPLAVLLTHGHYDHVSGVAEFTSRFNVPVYGHPLDFLSDIAAKYPYVGVSDIKSVDDGMSLEIGAFNVEVVHTPGHTPGSVCYLIGDNMFSGDTLFAGDIGRTDFRGGNKDDMRKSLKKLAAIENDYVVFPGHEESTALAEEKASNRYMR